MLRAMALRLYVVHNSHPCAAVEKALQLKGIAYRVWEWPPPVHVVAQRILFGARTVPALRNGREKVQGSRTIMHRLDQMVPEPALYPSDPERRAAVEEADRWGDEEFQQDVRDLIWAGAVHRPDALVSYGKGSRVPLPDGVVRAVAPAIARAQRGINRTGDAKARAVLQALPHKIARIDGWIADGTIGDLAHPNAADLQILSTVRLMSSLADVRPLFSSSRSLELAERLFGPIHGELPSGSLTTV
jgi:glutathione S-transferase